MDTSEARVKYTWNLNGTIMIQRYREWCYSFLIIKAMVIIQGLSHDLDPSETTGPPMHHWLIQSHEWKDPTLNKPASVFTTAGDSPSKIKGLSTTGSPLQKTNNKVFT